MFKESIDNEELLQLPIGTFDGEIVVINNQEDMLSAANYLRTFDVIGYDTETRPSFRKGISNKVSLLQLSGADRCYLIRLSQTRLSSEIISILEDSSITKVGAAIRDDIRLMCQRQRFTPSGFVDLQSMVSKFGIKELSVKKMAAIILGVRISKAQRLTNWEAKTLTQSQQIYAATDAWICREIYLKLTANKL
jgi:ribonuclease D